ncbi:MAG TPA: hypothetical protein VJ870_19660 [Amycolatopsis sp.]|nr:hypothetical protein [Amycolatopsis sp.]
MSVFDNSHGVYVDKVSVSADVPTYTCDGIFEAWGTLANGQEWRHRGQAKCGAGRVWFDWAPQKNFRNNSKVCGAIVKQNGNLRAEVACVKIFK